MFLNLDKDYKWNDKEGADKNYTFECRLDPETYEKLLYIIHKSGIVTFDISTAINYVIKNFTKK